MTNAIKRLTLTNFQSHSDTEIQPAPPGGLTVIVGPSGHGKTAILRGLRWLLYNQPQGMGFMRKGATMVQVVAELASGKVTRRRTPSTNQYIVVTESGPQVFEGFAGAVPLEVQQLTGVREVSVASLTLQPNLASQLAGPFLGADNTSAGDRAKVLGRIAGIDEVDLATKSLATDQFRRGQEEKRLEREVADLTAREASYVHLPELRQRIEQLEALTLRLTRADSRQIELMRLQIRLRDITETRQRAQEALDRWTLVLPGLEAAITRVEAAAARKAQVTTLSARSRTLSFDRLATSTTLQRWAGSDEALDWVIDCFAWLDRSKRVASRLTALREVRTGINATQTVISRSAGAEPALSILEATAKTTSRRNQLATALGRFRQIANSSATLQVALARLAGATRATEVLTAAIANVNWTANIKKLQSTLWRTQTLGAEVKQQILRLRKDIAADEQAYIETLTAAGRCPVCGSEIHPEHIKEAV